MKNLFVKNLIRAIGIVLAITTIISLAMGNEAVFAPMLMADFVFILIWKFSPREQSSGEKAAHWAIVSFGLFSALLSAVLSIIIPVFADQWHIEKHLDDAVLYPIVNDGRENCYIMLLFFIVYIGFLVYFRRKRKVENINQQ